MDTGSTWTSYLHVGCEHLVNASRLFPDLLLLISFILASFSRHFEHSGMYLLISHTLRFAVLSF